MKRVMTLATLATILAALALPASAQGSDPCVDAQNGIVPDGYELVYAPDQGGSGSQVVLGTSGDDVLNGGSGADILCGLGGDDILEGGSGSDRLDAGSGSNELYGGSGYDILIGMAGDVFDQGSGGGEIIATPVLDIDFVMLDEDTYTYAVQGAGLQPGSLVTIEIAALLGGIFVHTTTATADGTIPPAAGFTGTVDCEVNIEYKAAAITVYGDLIEAGGLEHLPPC